jgi:hypothetical protein
MTLITKALGGFYNGVSQQSSAVRLDTQCDIQENAMSSLINGLQKRPNSTFVASVSNLGGVTTLVHTINRDVNEKYLVLFTNNGTTPVQIYDTYGNAKVVNATTAAKNYILSGTGSARDKIKATTIADYTIVINNTVTTALSTALSSGIIDKTVETQNKLGVYLPKTLVWSVATSYSMSSRVKYDGWLYQSLIDVIGGSAPSTANGNWLDEKQRYADPGDIYAVTGNSPSDYDNAYFEMDSSGVWKQTIKPGIKYTFTNSTMPVKIVRESDGSFTVDVITWDNRLVGDDLSNPPPSFINNKISGVVFYKNRLGFISNDSICFSRAGDFFNFWAESALDIADDDPIDVSIASNQVAHIRSASAFRDSLLLLSDQQQFSLSSGNSSSFSPKNVTISNTTNYNICLNCTPVSAGTSLFFVAPKDDYVDIREYMVQPDTLIDDAANITAHIPNYIPNGFVQLFTCPAYDMLFAHSDSEPNSLFVYKYTWNGNTKIQTAWSKWIFNYEILGGAIIDSSFYMLTKQGDSSEIDVIKLEDSDTGDVGIRYHLDRLTTLTNCTYNGANSTFTLPYSDGVDMSLIDPLTNQELSTAVFTGDSCSVSGDWREKTLYCGENYIMKYRLSEFFLRDKQSNAIIDGRIQLKTLTLTFRNSGYFRVEVQPFMRELRSYTVDQAWSGVFIGYSTVGEVNLLGGEEKFAVKAKSAQTTVDIINDTYLPCSLQSGSWRGVFTKLGTTL